MRQRFFISTLHARRRAGYTLLELSISLAIIGMLVAILIPIINAGRVKERNDELQMKMDAIELALKGYRKKYDRLPCPAGLTDVPSSSKFGASAGDPGTCNTVASGACGTGAGATCRLPSILGAVPVRSLGLPDEMMFDPWGGRFEYVVHEGFTRPGSFSYYPPRQKITDGLTIRDENGNARATGSIIAMIMSHGENRHGAYSASGARMIGSSPTANDLNNCHCTSAAVDGTLDQYFYQRASTKSTGSQSGFDDIVRVYTRSSLYSASDLTDSVYR